MNNKKIIFLITVLILASFIFLSAKEAHYQDLKTGGENWFLYFDNPQGNGLAFDLENYSHHQNFQWELYLDNDKIQEGTETLPAGAKKTITPPINLPDIRGKKISIKVYTDGEEMDIYKFITSN